MQEQPSRPQCIALFTDFGEAGPYLGQMEMVLRAAGVTQPVVRLQSDAPAFDPRASAWLLAALVRQAPAPTLFLGVVDPGVGGERRPLLVGVDRHWFVGPDNGLFSRVVAEGDRCSIRVIDWRPERLSGSFHGRDLFAPVAAMVATGRPVPGHPVASLVGDDWPAELAQVIYIDVYGNACTGLRAEAMGRERVVVAGGRRITYARTFSEVPEGSAFWYANSLGLVEIAVNQGRADVELGLAIGSPVAV